MKTGKTIKFAFKIHRPVGKYRSFDSTYVNVKLDGHKVGAFHEIKTIPTELSIRLMVMKDDINEDGHPNCEWKWVTLKKRALSIDEAKKFMNDNAALIVANFNLRKD